MADVIEILVTALEELEYPVSELGSYADDETLPETFVQYQVLGSPDTEHYDNEPTGITYEFQINVYSSRATIKFDADSILRAKLIPLGFMRNGGRPLPMNKVTNIHTYTTTYKYHDSL